MRDFYHDLLRAGERDAWRSSAISIRRRPMQLVTQYSGSRAESRAAGAARHPEGAAADERAAGHAARRRGRSRRSSSRITSPTTATRIRIRCTSPRRCSRTARARASTKKLVYEKRLAVAAFGGANLIEDPNLFYAVAIVQPGHTPEEAITALIAELDRLKSRADHRPRAAAHEEPVRARLHPRTRDRTSRKPVQLAHAVVIHRDITTADGEFDIFQNITARPTSSAWRARTSPPENRLVHHADAVGRSGGDADGPMTSRRSSGASCARSCSVLVRARSAAQTRWPSKAAATAARARRRAFRPISIQTLPNGLQVVAVLHHEQPVVSMRMLVRAGGALDPKGKHGLAHLAGCRCSTQGAGGQVAPAS